MKCWVEKMKQEARKPGGQESGDRRTDDPFWISGFLLPSHGWMVTGLIFSTEQGEGASSWSCSISEARLPKAKVFS